MKPYGVHHLLWCCWTTGAAVAIALWGINLISPAALRDHSGTATLFCLVVTGLLIVFCVKAGREVLWDLFPAVPRDSELFSALNYHWHHLLGGQTVILLVLLEASVQASGFWWVFPVLYVALMGYFTGAAYRALKKAWKEITLMNLFNSTYNQTS